MEALLAEQSSRTILLLYTSMTQASSVVTAGNVNPEKLLVTIKHIYFRRSHGDGLLFVQFALCFFVLDPKLGSVRHGMLAGVEEAAQRRWHLPPP